MDLCGEVDFDKPSRRKQCTYAVAVSRKRKNEGADYVQPGIKHQACDLTRTANIFTAINIRQPQVAA